ncbi:MAG: hypothetical protein AAF721_11075 [Myxococcota bacterium]
MGTRRKSKTTAARWLGGAIVACLATAAGGCQEQEGTTVGPRGATLSSEDGRFSLEIPAGALADELDITITEIDCEPEDAVDICYEVGPVGVALMVPARVTYEVDQAMFEDFSAEELALLGEGSRDWTPLADREVEPTRPSVSANAVYLSSYALVLTEVPEATGAHRSEP